MKHLQGNIQLMKHSTVDQVTMNENQMHTRPLMSHMDHMEASKLGFFTINDLYVGKQWALNSQLMTLHLLPHFLPREEADSIPFSMQEFPKILQLFSISQGSPQAKTIENTLKHCDFKPIKGETKFCAATLELMLNFVHVTFGSNTPFKVLTTTHLTKSTTLQQN